jgi:transcriptional regulator with XRE-family HTH domain
MDVPDYREKLRQARERKGWSIHEAATHVADNSITSRENYYDIEQHEGDLTSCCSLNEITRISKLLDVHPRDLFCDEKRAAVSIKDVIEKIKGQCVEKKMSINEFEDIAGWRVESCLSNPAKALDEWNIDCLIDVSHELNIDWRCVIAGL